MTSPSRDSLSFIAPLVRFQTKATASALHIFKPEKSAVVQMEFFEYRTPRRRPNALTVARDAK